MADLKMGWTQRLRLFTQRLAPSAWASKLLVGALVANAQSPAPPIVPLTQATALDGHSVSLPAGLPGHATVLILGFGRHSAEATTAWEKPVRTGLAHTPAIAFYDMAMLAEVPGFVRPLVIRSIRKQVPDVLKPNFLPLTDNEAAWRRTAGYDAGQPDAAYVMVVDRGGHVRWGTHAPFTQAAFAALSAAATRIAAER